MVTAGPLLGIQGCLSPITADPCLPSLALSLGTLLPQWWLRAVPGAACLDHTMLVSSLGPGSGTDGQEPFPRGPVSGPRRTHWAAPTSLWEPVLADKRAADTQGTPIPGLGPVWGGRKAALAPARPAASLNPRLTPSLDLP